MFWKRTIDLLLVVVIILTFSIVFVPSRNAHSLHINTGTEPAAEESTMEAETTAPTIVEDDVHVYEERQATEIFQGNDVIRLYINIYRNPQTPEFYWQAINGIGVLEPQRMLDTPEALNATFLSLVMPGDESGVPLEMADLTTQKKTNSTIRVVHSYPGRGSQKSYEIVMDDGCDLWGNQKIITLHKFENDGLRFRSRLIDELLRDVPQLVAPHTQFVRLLVRNITNDDPRVYIDYGLYTMVEHLDAKTIVNYGLSDKGELYMMNNFDFGRYASVVLDTADPAYDKAKMDEYIENRTGSNNKKLIAMLDAINNAEMTSDKLLSTYFDRENILYWMAFQILTGNVDSRTNNSYLYSPPNSQKWFLLANDFSTCLHRFEYEQTGWNDQKEWESGISNYWSNSLYQRFLKNKQFRSDLDEVIQSLSETVLSRENVLGKAQPLREVVTKYLYIKPDLSVQTYSNWMYDQVYDKLPDEISLNRTLYENSLNKPTPFYIKSPMADQGQLYLSWDPAVNLDGSDVTYTAELSADPQFFNPIERQTGLRLPAARLKFPAAGTYYVRVTAESTSGLKQPAMDVIFTDQGFLYGMKAFQVNASGQVIEIVS